MTFKLLVTCKNIIPKVHYRGQLISCINSPERLPDIAASSVDTWKSLRASSTCAAVAKGNSLIFASDSEILIIASSCLKSKYKYDRALSEISNSLQSHTYHFLCRILTIILFYLTVMGMLIFFSASFS